MPPVLKMFIWMIVLIGLTFVFKMLMVFVLPAILVIYAAGQLYQRYVRKGPRPTGRVFYYDANKHQQGSSNKESQEYTTVIDADDMTKEYKIPKI